MKRMIGKVFSTSILVFMAPFAAVHAGSFPVQVENCGVNITIEKSPQRIFLVNNDSISLLEQVGMLDRVIARTAEPVEGVYSEDTVKIISEVPIVSKKRKDTGGSIITLESVLAYKPDLVLAPESSIDRDLLLQSGIPLYSPPAYCKSSQNRPSGEANFQRVFERVRDFGKMFGVTELAESKIKELSKLIESFDDKEKQVHGTAIAIYVAASGTLYPYGTASMVTPIFKTVGLENVYGDVKERVFEASIEDILGRNPETIVLLYSHNKAEDVIAAFKRVSGTQALSAVKNNRVIALEFAFTDPPTPHSILGTTRLAKKVSELGHDHSH
ncbi:ABC transporter substrate-binding protein [Vibrio nigripulchritudo]|uniref:ABC transporter substrate-binding protein n=1 Tax=Vibrio nigripulchritudo TaxID=28173 RepID=UPI0005FA8889|nr:ABC transporter substrate-binding protein [Vibrio nigripulchritudo]KJY73635.1 hypothetical protein TW74_20040 [Vibrio nigripulchritudo]